MTEDITKKSALGRKIVLGVVALGLAAMFLGSLVYRFANPELQKTMRQAQAPSGMGGNMGQGAPEGMMDMDAVRQMLQSLEDRIAQHPEDVEALMQAANIYVMRRDKETALGYLQRARKASGGEVQALMQLSRLFFDLEEFETARACVEDILKADPDNMFAHFNLGVILKYRLDNKKEAEEHFRIVVDGDHSFEDLRNEAKKELQ